MAQSIKLGNDVYLDASGVDGIKATLTSGNLDDYYGTHKSGIYYLGAAQSAFTNAPAGWAALIVCSVGAVSFQLVYRYNGIWVRDRSGSPATWQAWRKANIIRDDTDWVVRGTIDTTNIPSGGAVAVSSITLPAGIWTISGYINYPSNANGAYRNASIRSVSASGNVYVSSQCPPCSGATTRCSTTTTIELVEDTTFVLTADHDAGSALTIAGARFMAARIA